MTKPHSGLDDAPPDWQTIELPESQVLRRRKPWHIRLNSMGIQNLMLALKANPDAAILFLCISVHTGSHNDHAEWRRLHHHSHTTGIRNGLRDPAYDDLVTDAHCHPTDLPSSEQTVRDVGLGGLSSMATRTTDQELVSKFSENHGRRDEDEYGDERESKRRRRAGPEVVACFGYHPWFCHLLHLGDPERQPSKEDHYASIFLPSEASTSYTVQKKLLEDILPDLPEPISVKPLVEQMRRHAVEAQKRGSLVMIGEVGLDRSFRVPFPGHKADHCGEHAEEHAPSTAEAEARIALSGEEEVAKNTNQPELVGRSKNLTLFRPSMEHQIALLEMQMDLAVELGINVSLHSVKAQGPTLDFLKRFKKKHGAMFTDRVNVDVHSCGGWSVESWVDAEKHFPNLFLSPSIAISGRTPVTPHLIRAADPSRLLVESDTHLIQDTTKRVWASAVWVAKCRGWKIEMSGEDFTGEEAGVVKRLESNWERFMNL